MSYALKPGRSVDREVRRLVDKQLRLAMAKLRDVGDRKSDYATHSARRHVKKVRALMRLVQPALGDAFDGANKRMRSASRLLAPIADAQALVGTLSRLRKGHPRKIPRRTFVAIRKGLLQSEARVDQKAKSERVVDDVTDLLRAQRKRVPQWRLRAGGFRAVESGLERTFRRARKAMHRATRHPTVDHYRVWRLQVKALWYQVRLLDGRCGGELSPDSERLEALDDCLGELHNVALLSRLLTKEGLASRQKTAGLLRVLRKRQKKLRGRAAVLGAGVFEERPRHFVKRVKRLWKSQSRPIASGVEPG